MRSLTLKLLVVVAIGLSACQRGPDPIADASIAAAAYLVENGKKPGVKTLPSGLQYQIVRSGPETGPRPREGDEVKVHYEGKLVDGTVFDSSYATGAPAVFGVGGLIAAWNEILPLMQPGDEFIVTVPPHLGYGTNGSGPIPPNSVLIFRMELVDILSARTGTALG